MADTIGEPDKPIWTQPLRLRVNHVTRYHYHDDVWDSFNEARLQPLSDDCQTCEQFELRIQPQALIRDYPDFYTNCVHYFDIVPPHRDLSVHAISLVNTHMDNRGPTPLFCHPASLLDKNVREDYHLFLQDSQFVSLEPEIWRESMDAHPGPIEAIWHDTVILGRHVFQNFKYAPSLTTVNTKPKEVITSRQGVCQDFAHLLLGMCRCRGIPARYVSGYFYNPNRKPDEVEASHAWIEVFLPGYGWKGYDPTHDRVPDTRYVKLAIGRDYADIRPLCGTFRGKGTREMIVDVRIQLADEEAEVANAA